MSPTLNNETTTPAISDNSNELPDCSLPSPKQAILGVIESSTRIETHDTSSNSDLLSLVRGSRVLFYPGAGEDITPALRFAALGIVDTIVYCDYLVTQGEGASGSDEIFQKFEFVSQDTHEELLELPHNPESDAYQLQMRQTVTAHDFGQTCRADFFPKTGCRFGIRDDDFHNPVIGSMAIFEKMSDGKILRFLYLDTEAIQTYLHIWGSVQLAPGLLVIQDHGFGGHWTPFGGESLLHEVAPVLPEFLWVGHSNTNPWPSYQAISHPVREPYSMHNSERILYACTQAELANPKSPLFAPEGESEISKKQRWHKINNLRFNLIHTMNFTVSNNKFL